MAQRTISRPFGMIEIMQIVASALSILLFVIFRRKKTEHPDLKTCHGWPILGSALEFDTGKMINTLKEYPKKYGNIVQCYIFNQHCLVITRPDLIHDIMKKRPKLYQRVKSIEYLSDVTNLHAGVFTANKEWHRIRKGTSPSFNQQNLTNKLQSLLTLTKTFIQSLRNLQAERGNSREPIEMLYQLTNYTKSVITVVGMGIEPNDPVCQYFFTPDSMKHLNEILRFYMESLVFPFPRWCWRYFPAYRYETIARAADKHFTNACKQILEYKRNLHKEGKLKQPFAMLDNLFAKENKTELMMSDDDLIANMKTFYIAGSDTTANGLAWICYYFCTQPECKERVRKELVDNLLHGKRLEEVDMSGWTYDTILTSLPYTHAAFKESQRLSGAASTLIHQLQDGVEKDTLPNGLEISGDTVVFLNVEGIHYNERMFPNPTAFQPERWLIQDKDRLANMDYNYFAFGGGTRVCPGQQLAMLEATIAAALLAYSFDFALACPKEEIHRVQSFTICPNWMPVHLTPVKHD
jgi:cytochrome P450